MRTNGIGALSALAAALLLAACGGGSDGGHDFDSNNANQAQANIQQVVVFGDSLNDVGTYNPTTLTLSGPGPNPPSPGLAFTTKPGAPWTSYVALNYNFYLQPYQRVDFGLITSLGGPGQVVTLGGTDYAQGGATVLTDAPAGGVVNDATTGNVPVQEATAWSVKTQLDKYLAANLAFNAHQLILIDGGANDILNYVGAAAKGLITPSQAGATAVVSAAATGMVQQLQRLVAAGATNIVYSNVPDIGKTPLGFGIAQGGAQGQALQALATQMSTGYNAAVAAGIANTKIITFDAAGLLQTVQANMAQYGMINVTSPACTTVVQGSISALPCTTATLTAGATDSNYLFADVVHPTNGAHKIWAQAVIQQIQATIPK